MSEFRVFAPATVANVGPGFDILGFAIEGVGDHITVKKGPPGIRIVSENDVPLEPEKNTATVGMLRMLQDFEADFGLDVFIEKGIPISSGLGGSAASAVAGVFACDAVLEIGLELPRLLDYALLGEEVASGVAHPDNAAPCLYGGLTLARSGTPPDVMFIPVPDGLSAVIVHPDVVIRTRDARAILPSSFLLADIVEQTANLAEMLVGAFTQDAQKFAVACQDVLIEPHRSRLIPGYGEARESALRNGALAFSISGSGPAVFSLVESEDARRVQQAVVTAFRRADLECRSWISKIGGKGARLV